MRITESLWQWGHFWNKFRDYKNTYIESPDLEQIASVRGFFLNSFLYQIIEKNTFYRDFRHIAQRMSKNVDCTKIGTKLFHILNLRKTL